jgi:2-polyprenyl-3-methyl-5-hydroxy-6-metoxy-1,4-benzoquinol methylase
LGRSLVTDLAAWRREAVARSGGTSDDVIKRLVLRLLRASGATGSLLDFGAGRGELLLAVHERGGMAQLHGIDMLARPEHLPAAIHWEERDLNEPLRPEGAYDVVVCSETIEHLENPRAVMRTLHRLLRPAGTLILTTPNQESLRSLAALGLRGHFVQFLGECYPAHITALLRVDLVRICAEVGFSPPAFCYTDEGAIPKLTRLSWQRASFGLLRGRLFSDNLGMVARKPA